MPNWRIASSVIYYEKMQVSDSKSIFLKGSSTYRQDDWIHCAWSTTVSWMMLIFIENEEICSIDVTCWLGVFTLVLWLWNCGCLKVFACVFTMWRCGTISLQAPLINLGQRMWNALRFFLDTLSFIVLPLC